MTEVGPADRSRLLRSKHDECSAIVNSRKRKLRQLFAVATQVDGLPTHDFSNTDAPPPTPAEIQFLQSCDILQGRTFNDLNIPARPKLRYDVLKHSLQNSGLFATENTPPGSEKAGVVDVPKSQPALAPPEQQPFATRTGQDEAVPQAQTSSSLVPPSGTATRPLGSQGKDVLATERLSGRTDTLRSKPSPAAPFSSTKQSTIAAKDPSYVSGQEAEDSVEGEAVEKPSAAAQAVPIIATGQQDTRTTASSQKILGQSTLQGRAIPPPERQHADEKLGETGFLAIKLPHDTSRVPDVLSSPGSTAQTATTPAVHDVSTDTSPDNEGPQYVERGDGKDDEDAPEDGLSGHEDDLVEARQRRAEGHPDEILDDAEAQLLQESMGGDLSVPNQQSPDTRSNPDQSKRDASSTTVVDNSVHNQKSATLDNEPTAISSGTAATLSANEIPDSQDSSPADKMDLDPPPKPTDEPQKLAAQQEDVSRVEPRQASPKTPLPMDEARLETSQGPERAVTRVSSGAIRQKSVSEILGETPRPLHASTEKAISVRVPHSQLTPVTSTPQSPTSRSKGFPSRRKDKPKNQPSTVVFGKQPKRLADKSIVPSQQKQSFLPTDDYFTPLFVQGFTQTSKWMKPIEVILNQAHKTVSTPDAYVALQDNQACRVLRRVYHLQQNDKWSLRQPKRCPEPTRPESHWDVLLQEMKWMRTDFREERKWKMAVARNLAAACADWFASSLEDRKALQVPAFIPPKVQQGIADISMADLGQDALETQSTPDLMPSGELDSSEQGDELRDEILETVAPSAIFALQDDDVVFGLQQSPTADQLLGELPMYGTPLKVPSFDFTGPEFDPDAQWRRPALPLSRYVEGQMKLVSDGPPRKRSRYQYEEDDEDEDEDDRVVFGGHSPKRARLPPQNSDVALFNPDMKPIRDRLHAGHQFRPPAEYQMPMQTFYESRSPSQWTLVEDDELRALVREYSYNWSLISSMLTTKSLFAAGAERRTPWECFERWINLEGLPSDMQKTQYFKAYQNRIDAAQRVILQQNQLAQQQAAGPNGPVTPIARRRPSTPLRVERRRNQKHLTLIDAMRKLAKKRETAAQKQQHASQMAAMRKANEAVQPRGPVKTPRDYSLMRWERDQQLAEKVAQFHQRQETQRRQMAMQARAQGQATGQVASTPGAGQVPPNGTAPLNPNAPRPNVPNQLAVPGQVRGRMPMQVPANAMGAVPAQMGGLVPPMAIPQAQMQAAMQAQHRMPVPNPQPDVQLIMQARRISEQQRQAVQLQQAQQQGHQGPHMQQANPVNQSHSPPTIRNPVNNVNGVNVVNGVNNQNFISNAQAMMAQLGANGAGMASPSTGGLHMPNVPAGSPRPPGVQPQISANIASQLSALESQFRQKNPNLSPEQARQMATEHLTRVMMVQRQNMSQSAMNAAAGAAAGSPTMPNGIAATTSPHQYAALLRQQQQQQQAAAAAAAAAVVGQHQRQSSGSATPSLGK